MSVRPPETAAARTPRPIPTFAPFPVLRELKFWVLISPWPQSPTFLVSRPMAPSLMSSFALSQAIIS